MISFELFLFSILLNAIWQNRKKFQKQFLTFKNLNFFLNILSKTKEKQEIYIKKEYLHNEFDRFPRRKNTLYNLYNELEINDYSKLKISSERYFYVVIQAQIFLFLRIPKLEQLQNIIQNEISKKISKTLYFHQSMET